MLDGATPMAGRQRLLVATLIWALFTAATLYFAAQSVPAINGDAVYFIPTAYSIRASGTWLSPAAGFLDPSYDGTQPARYVYHGWLYPFVVAKLAPWPSWQGIFLARGIVASLALAGALACAAPALRTTRALAAFATVAIAVLSYLSGRPETLALPLVMALAWRTLFRQPSIVIDGTILALLFACQPTICMVAAVGYSAYRFQREPSQSVVASILATGAVAIVLALLSFALIYPFSLADWIAGISHQARLLAARSEWHGFRTYYVTDRSFPLLGVPIIGGAAILLMASFRAGAAVPLRALRVGLAALFLAILLFNPLKVPPTIYTVMPWVLIFAWYVLSRREPGPATSVWGGRTAAVLLAILLLTSTLSMVRSTIQNSVSSLDRHALPEAGRQIVQRVLQSCRYVRVNFPVLPLLGSAASSPRLRYADQPLGPGAPPFPDTPDAVIRSQSRADATDLPQIPAMAVVYSSYAPSFEIPGLPTFNTPTAHNFAVLLRTGSSCMANFAAAHHSATSVASGGRGAEMMAR